MTQPTTATPDLRLADWAMQTKRSPLQDMLVMTARPNLISFGLGLPNQDLFPREAFAQAAAHALHTEPRTLQYGPTTSRLKQQIVELMTKRGVTCTEANIFLTAGAQQGINLLTRLLLEP
ncbi:MAG TPA: PLP-dependent aminotransferase family protein, partial [Bacilli bacterium]|nr:PLP-dependent aminotransferase family protein [Bacilli bacterium]